MTRIDLAFGLTFEDLHARAGLARLDAQFIEQLKADDSELFNRLMAGRAGPEGLEPAALSGLILDLAPHLEGFLGHLFGIEAEIEALFRAHTNLTPLYACKRLFVQRRAAKKVKPDEARRLNGDALAGELSRHLGGPFDELAFATRVMNWLDDEAAHAEAIECALNYAAWALHADAGRARHAGGILFQQPRKIDPLALVPVATEIRQGVTMMRLPDDHLRARHGFALTDQGADLSGALDEANYCIFCHNQGKDSCSSGLRDRKTGAFAKSPFDVTLAGCPLDEKISEMNLAKSQGHGLAALAIAVIDNAMVVGTGHRICNDCMKSCIYQRQQPVDIPQMETRTAKDVLALPWGFEIYSLLTRWNPLNLARPLPRPDSGRRVLIVGQGPAGFTLAHHLINDGHTVVAIDGLKIEPLPADISGVTAHGERVAFHPIRDVNDLYEDLDDRVMAGFGGVAEYGITVRWNKNFLKLIRLLLERRAEYALFGGVRFGGALTVEDAFAAGFDHVALAVGAGKPTVLDIPNGLARGVRAASDFLMALQLTGAAKASSLANLQLRLPVVVVGGGLTAIDTATEALAYYPVQVEKFLHRYEALLRERGEAPVRAAWNAEETEIADEFLAHGRALRAEREAARKEGRKAGIQALLDSWGGVCLAYRKRMIDAPSYTLNHEEIEKALEEGIRFAECLSPLAIKIDAHGHTAGLRLAHQERTEDGKWRASGEESVLPARAVLVAAGTHPNTVIAREDPAHFSLDGKYFQAFDEDGQPASPEWLAKPEKVVVLARIGEDGRAVSFFGDVHPSFSGNVVKAMGSAKQGYPVVSRMLARVAAASSEPRDQFLARLNTELRPVIHKVERLTPTIIEVVVKAPMAARAFRPGNFYRLQNYETQAARVEDTILAMEGLALTGAWVDREQGLVSTIVLEMGGSSDLCAQLQPGEPVVLMGPTGTPTETPGDETVLLLGGGLGNAVQFSIGQALRAAGSRVIYFAGYKSADDRYKIEQIEAAADLVVWCCDQAPGFTPSRPGDRAFIGNIVEAVAAYGRGDLGATPIELNTVDRIIAIGSDGMMAAVGAARHGILKDMLKPGHVAIGSINSPMQCMMKEVCAQCLQPQHDPITGKTRVVFSCFNQDQGLDEVDFPALRERLRQNGTHEKLTAQWIDHCLKHLGVRAEAG